MENGDSLGAFRHYNFINFVSVFDKKMDSNVVSMIGDNLFTNQTPARRVRPKFVGYSRHRFSFREHEVVSQHTAIIDIVRMMMIRV